MKLLRHFTLIIFLTEVLTACISHSHEAAQKTKKAHLAYWKQHLKSDEISAVLPQLMPIHTFKDSSRIWIMENYYTYQLYKRKGENHPFTGSAKSTAWNDSLKAIGFFIKGRLQKLNEYYTNGQKKRVFYLSSRENHHPFIVEKSWYYTGEFKSKTDQRGLGKVYYKDGSVKEQKMENKSIDFWRNGKKQALWTFVKESDQFYISGPWKGWYKNGQLGIAGQYLKNKKDGRWIYYDSLGHKQKMEYYSQGKLDSTKQLTAGT